MFLDLALGPLLLLSLVWGLSTGFLTDIHLQHVGCFKDDPSARDLENEVTTERVAGSLGACIEACAKTYFQYAGVQNGYQCFCGASYGRYGPSTCHKACKNEPQVNCGGRDANAVYSTGVKVPGPPTNLQMSASKTNSISVSWMPPTGISPAEISHYLVNVELKDSFDKRRRPFFRELQLSGQSTTVIGLKPATSYNMSVAAVSSDGGRGPIVSEIFWTEIEDPPPPPPPQLIRHEHGDNDAGELHVKLLPLEDNPFGPITSYRVVVINETDDNPIPFSTENLAPWKTANEIGLRYWLAAEIGPEWFDSHHEFVVGDGRQYGPYVNHGPLEEGHDFHITIGIVSTWNNVTKVSYAKVSHDQHHKKNILVFRFHEDNGHDHDHHDSDLHYHSSRDKQELSTALIAAIVVTALLLIAALSLTAVLRFRRSRSSSTLDAQELTRTRTSDVESDCTSYDNDALDTFEGDLAAIRTRSDIRQIPRNFLEITHEVIGVGQFGSVMRGTVKSAEGTRDSAIFLIIPFKTLHSGDLRALVRSIDVVARCRSENVLRLAGLCEEHETTYVVLEGGITTLKQSLLDSRTLIHNPTFADKYENGSSIPEETLLTYVLGIARGMEHLAEKQILHGKLCCRNIALTQNIPKIAGFGIATFNRPGQNVDLGRWLAQETLQAAIATSKSDIWSFAVVVWEILTLGGTPYAGVKSSEIPARVCRGLRPRQTASLSDSIYQLMLECWQIDPDERPSFKEITSVLSRMAAQSPRMTVNNTLTSSFEYEAFSNELELLSY